MSKEEKNKENNREDWYKKLDKEKLEERRNYLENRICKDKREREVIENLLEFLFRKSIKVKINEQNTKNKAE